MIDVKLTRLRENGLSLPSYESGGAAGADIRADLSGGSLNIKPNERKLVPTGFAMEIPTGFEVQVRPRSGLALNHGVTMVNAPGTIDSDYRGEIGVILINMGNTDYHLQHGERIAQMVLAPVSRGNWIESAILSTTERGQSGFGSTGS